MKAEIISIGTELLMGELTDTNAPFIASRLPPLGIPLEWVSQVGDDLDQLTELLKRGLSRSDVIFTSGGLGPTQDDLTRESVAKALGEEPSVNEDMLEHLRDFFRRRGTDMPATNIKQATLIPSAQTIPNARGTAPGWWVDNDGKIIVCMPGPPGELHGMWEEEVAPRLRERSRGDVILTRNIKTTGLSEGKIDEMVAEYLGKENPYLGIYAKPDGIHLRIIARASDEEKARALIQPVERGLDALVGPYVWGYDDDSPEQAVAHLLVQKGLTLGTMESVTGGLLANSITSLTDSYRYFRGGVVINGVESAIASGVPKAAIERHGTVSQEAAAAMAQAAREVLSAGIGIGITGVARPGATEGKPVGQVYLAIATDSLVQHYESRLPPQRALIRQRAATTALIELRRFLGSL